MNLYLIEHPHPSHNQYDAAIVAANTEDEARSVYPSLAEDKTSLQIFPNWSYTHMWENEWVKNPSEVQVKLIGKALDRVTDITLIESFFQYG